MATQKAAPKKSIQRKASKAVSRKTDSAPGSKPVIVRTSERRSFRRCRQQWWWAYREGLVPPFAANALWFGEGIHFALAEWYDKGTKRKSNPAGLFADWVGDERRRIWTTPNPDVDETEIVDALDLGVAMLTNYVEVYGDDPEFDFIKTEQPFQIVIPSREPDANSKHQVSVAFTTPRVLYAGTFDGVYRDKMDGKPWLVEHKTTKAIQTTHLPLDDQAGSYWMVATTVLRDLKLIGPHESLEGIKYNFLRKAMPDARPRNDVGEYLNKDGSVSLKQPAPYFHREPVFRFQAEHDTQLRRIQDEALEMRLVRDGTLPVTKNPTGNCSFDCAFFNMCQLHETGDDWEAYKEQMYQVADPYWAHRKSAAE